MTGGIFFKSPNSVVITDSIGIAEVKDESKSSYGILDLEVASGIINGGNYKASATNFQSIVVMSGSATADSTTSGDYVINGGTFVSECITNASSVLQFSGKSLTINGGTFSGACSQNAILAITSYNNVSTITVNGGVFTCVDTMFSGGNGSQTTSSKSVKRNRRLASGTINLCGGTFNFAESTVESTIKTEFEKCKIGSDYCIIKNSATSYTVMKTSEVETAGKTIVCKGGDTLQWQNFGESSEG